MNCMCGEGGAKNGKINCNQYMFCITYIIHPWMCLFCNLKLGSQQINILVWSGAGVAAVAVVMYPVTPLYVQLPLRSTGAIVMSAPSAPHSSRKRCHSNQWKALDRHGASNGSTPIITIIVLCTLIAFNVQRNNLWSFLSCGAHVTASWRRRRRGTAFSVEPQGRYRGPAPS